MNVLEAKEIAGPPGEDAPDAIWAGALQSTRYQEVEQRVVRQLVQALIYEDILPYKHLPEGAGLFVLEGRTADGRPVQYRCPGAHKVSFGRVMLDQGPVLRVAGDGKPAPAGLYAVLSEIVGQVAQAERVAAFMDELEQTLLKDLQAQSQPPARLPAALRDYDELEGDIMDGHLYHPCYKSRIGFSLADNRRYGPEFKQPLRLHWVAVRKRSGRMNHSARIDHRTLIQQELGDADYRRFASILHAQNENLEDYWLLPVHPWQWQERIACRFHPELATREVIWLGVGRDSYRAQQSIRTLANRSARQKAYVKLSLSITNTSTSRILAAHTVMNGPIVTDWLQGLLDRDPDAKALDFIILGEVLGISYDYDSLPEPRRANAYGTLGAIWRESLHRYLRRGESATPFNGLCHVEAGGRPLIDPWIQQGGVRAWTQRLLHVTVSPIIHMLFAHGIGMESHAQNIVLIHRDGWPARIALKDFHDGVRFSPRHLASPKRAPALVPVPAGHACVNRNSFILTDDADAVRDFSCDAFFFICLAELAIFLARHYALPEQEFWSMTATVIRDYQARHRQHGPRFNAFDVFAETFQVEALAKRRLLGDSEPRFKSVPNPLRAFGRSPC